MSKDNDQKRSSRHGARQSMNPSLVPTRDALRDHQEGIRGIKLHLDPGISPNQLAAVLKELGKFYRSCGGDGLHAGITGDES